ncbi:MAG: hypothetical protein OXC44_01565 [Proteobacteria bacterium]|nr:hypothetical protein [Pseudomonadota bacterium]
MGIILQLSSCRSSTSYKQETSDLHGAYDDRYSLVLQKYGQDLRFVTCLRSPQNFLPSSCVAALQDSDGRAVNYNFLPGEALKPEDLKHIETLKAKLAEDYLAEHGKLPANFEVITAGVGSAALSGMGMEDGRHVKAVKQLLAQDKVLSAKIMFSDLFDRNAFVESEHLELLSLFDDVDRIKQLKGQALLEWQFFVKRAEELVRKKENISDLIKEMTQFHDDVTFWQFTDTGDLSEAYFKAMDEFMPPATRKQLTSKSGGTRTVKNQIIYNVKAKQNRSIRHLAAIGGYDKASALWRTSTGTDILDDVDQIIYGKDLSPFKVKGNYMTYMKDLQKQYSALYQLTIDKIFKGDNVHSLLGKNGSLRNVVGKLSEGDGVDYSKLLQSIERRASSKGLLTYSSRTFRTDRVTRRLLVDTAEALSPLSSSAHSQVSVSRSHTYISSKRSFPLTKILGWGVSLVAGAVILFAIVDSAASKTVVDLESLSNEKEHEKEQKEDHVVLPFIPVSVYEDYLPVLSSLDPHVTVKVPSIAAVLKILALHAAGGRVALAKGMSYCLPALQAGLDKGTHPSLCYQVTAVE